ncbi:MAG TPA: replication-associated recombination protein A [Saprospiraceae bacterium]|nr:replication-associated recombination protein A [Saprospiraceae bacterium]
MRPLAERMRPTNLDDYVGQASLTGKGAVLRNAIEADNIPSIILWGPPGVGKTTLASIIAHTVKKPFFKLSAINSGVKDIRETIKKIKSQRFFDHPNAILFIDEIHRFSKSQQDALLGAVEDGTVTLIGATTENPSFEVNNALLSRAQVYVLKPLEKEDLIGLVRRALTQDEFLKAKNIEVKEYDAMLRISGGDARKLYNVLEILANTVADGQSLTITNNLVEKVIKENITQYDKSGEQHYDIISAFIKSIRGSDPNAALYYLAAMLHGGEDIKFIARRLIIVASEDIGLANPNGLLLANACFQACHTIGMPEARIILSETTIYLANSPKSNTAYKAIDDALAEIRQNGLQPIPLHLRNAPTKLMKSLDYGKDYQYAHQYEGNFIAAEFLPEKMAGTKFYTPGQNAQEEKTRLILRNRWKDKYGY